MFLRVTPEQRTFLLQFANGLRETPRETRIIQPGEKPEEGEYVVITSAAALMIADTMDKVLGVDREPRPSPGSILVPKRSIPIARIIKP